MSAAYIFNDDILVAGIMGKHQGQYTVVVYTVNPTGLVLAKNKQQMDGLV